MTMVVVKGSEDPHTTLVDIPMSSDAHRLMGRFEGARRLDSRGGYAMPTDQVDTFIRHARVSGWHVYDRRTTEPTVLLPPAFDGPQRDPRQEEINQRGMALVRAVNAAYTPDVTITETMCKCGHLADHHQYRDTDETVLVALPDETRDVTCQHVGASEADDCSCSVVCHESAG